MKKVITDRLHLPGKQNEKWHLNRRKFIGSVLAGGVMAKTSFSRTLLNFSPEKTILNEKQTEIIRSIQQILFPDDGNGPGANEINAFKYLIWVMDDPYKDPEEIAYIKKGITWVEETSVEMHNTNYNSLSQQQKEMLVQNISIENWGESWLSVNLSIIIEALLCDPKYGSNPNETGWKWLEHYAGQPRPTQKQLYPMIIDDIRNARQKSSNIIDDKR